MVVQGGRVNAPRSKPAFPCRQSSLFFQLMRRTVSDHRSGPTESHQAYEFAGQTRVVPDPAKLPRARREYAFFFQAGFFMRSKETTAAQQADMATAIKLQVAVDVSAGELGPLR